jgi:glucosamine--fructose-6-phosphate aminotransferase (isomerizing)
MRLHSEHLERFPVPTLMMQSINEQPEAIQRILSRPFLPGPFAEEFLGKGIAKAYFVGSGTSLFAAMISAQSWAARLTLDCQAVSSLEFFDMLTYRSIGPETLVVAISQSGASLILREVVRRANEAGAMTVAITADPHAVVSAEAGFVFETHTGPEENLGKTKGFLTTAFVSAVLGAALAERAAGATSKPLQQGYGAVPALVQQTLDASRPLVREWATKLREADALFVVGSGVQVPIALEGALKILEVAKMPVIAKELEEMMHGPFNGVGPSTGMIVLGDKTSHRVRLDALVRGAAHINVPTFSIATGTGIESLFKPFDLVLPGNDDDALRAILTMLPLQLLAHDLAAERGADIDRARYPLLYPIFASKTFHTESE